ncbi:alpha/beta fold hydrolase [Nocardiopsis sp. CT-R113]|uniref:Alpha/beta fold hydrolase n=1 Tax=Nocardiopsis codii TaxID=3065942 RepID=A0ABU7K4D8_9ACTN|nr:alpha/beta fold hydrolase [Nocardiopsis sp. CT-R113]MEE2037114.1 alpha/beta fold hydrolase [Nocardiopsis sp. CT-R113]
MSTIYKSEAGAAELRSRYQEELRTWPVPADHLRLPTREGETFVLASGPPDAPPVVLLHGSGANATMWREDTAVWARHLRTYAVDLVGEPGLSAPSRPPLDSDAYVRWLDEVLDHLGLADTAVVGISLGGWMALEYATHRPQRVSRLALLCPGGVGAQKTAWLFRALLLRPFGRWGARRSVRVVTGLDMPLSRPVLEHLMLTFAQFRPRTERLPVFSDDALRRLAMPVQVTVGASDVMFDSAGTADRVRRCVPHATVNVLPGVGHALLDQTEPVLEFLRG